MNPNREHIDDEVSVEVDVVADFKTWHTQPPRRAKRDLIGAPLVVVFAVAWFVYVIVTASYRALPSGGIVLAGVVWAAAEVLPERAVRPAMVLRIVGTVLSVAAIVSVLVLGIVDAT